ncbi:MAG: hypothetical protein SOW48_02525 [Peptoniphilaceae bacterium]|nr:hypothetical protein [Peptoniphilaceae bacterium]MDY3075501.1 hypothetical protein [Peptoniphilaceae bacterium]
MDDIVVVTESFGREGAEPADPLRVMKDETEFPEFRDLVYIEEDRLQKAMQRAVQAEEVYDPLSKDKETTAPLTVMIMPFRTAMRWNPAMMRTSALRD